MSLLARPTVVFAIVFGCFAVLIPRVFLPLFRSKSSASNPNMDDRMLLVLVCSSSSIYIYSLDFRRTFPPVTRNDHSDHVEHVPVSVYSIVNDLNSIAHSLVQGTPPHMRGAHPSMRMHHPGVQGRAQGSTEHSSSKSIVTLALPMYTVGIGVFFVYTCCKVSRSIVSVE
jgi:hypothetical protein